MTTPSSNTEHPDPKSEQFKHLGETADAITNEARGRAARALISLNSGARFMWHAYLGTLVTVEEKLVSTASDMAKVGSKFETKTKKQLSKQVDKAQASSAKLRKQAQERITDVEQVFDKGVNRSLHFLGVPTRQDMNQLTGLIQNLTDSVNDLAGKTGVPPRESGSKEKRTKASSTSASA